jgi:hypothetical protein
MGAASTAATGFDAKRGGINESGLLVSDRYRLKI